MVKLRLKRFGKKFEPHYRLVVIKARTKRDGKALEDLGHYSPITKICELKTERIKYWLAQGAQVTKTVENLLIRNKILEAKKFKYKYENAPKKKSVERQQQKDEKKAKPVEEEKTEIEQKPEQPTQQEDKASETEVQTDTNNTTKE